VLKPRSHGDGCAIQVDKANQIWILGKAEHYGVWNFSVFRNFRTHVFIVLSCST